MKKMIVILSLLLLTACGTSPREDTAVAVDEELYVLPDADIYITIADSIGIEIGDSNYVFGAIVGAQYTPSGEIAILDMQKYSINIYTPAGEFIKSIGRQGSGPGEFLLPIAFSFANDGGMVVSDAMATSLVMFDSAGVYTNSLTGFFPTAPPQIVCIDDNAIIGMKPEFEQTEDGMFMGFTVARWEEGETEPSVTYYSKMSPFDPSDISSIEDDVVFFGASQDGIVFTAEMSSEEYTFTAWSPDGEELFVMLDDNFEKVEKTPEEIEQEIELVNARMIQQGMPPEMANWEPSPYKSAIAGIFVDSNNRIWIWRGTEQTPVFDVYDLEGNLLFVAALDAGDRAETLQIVISRDGFVAFDSAPEYYPVLYYGKLPL